MYSSPITNLWAQADLTCIPLVLDEPVGVLFFTAGVGTTFHFTRKDFNFLGEFPSGI
jgi:hypothetical protein